MASSSPQKAESTAIIGSVIWQVFSYGTVTSTNDLARELPPWSAVRAQKQTAGRGRFGRQFVSDPGGLWLSASLPAAGGAGRWNGFSLMLGSHLLHMLENLEVPDVRLRWPNDLMSGKKKLAGLLIEQGPRETLTVGIGMNVVNSPWDHDSSLAETTTRLLDLLPVLPDLQTLALLHLEAIANARAAMLRGGLSSAVRDLNKHWANERLVEIALAAGATICGRFVGLTQDANLRVLLPSGEERLIPHHHVVHLQELA
jgi:BirA family transcriptional regulator, biotin operon repressor / biotin---[acetyl-CoA-carboxylase] ligase